MPILRLNRILIASIIVVSMSNTSMSSTREPGEPTWGRMATDALLSGHLEEAIMLFEEWRDADPNNNVDWYDHACALSLHGDTAKAMDALAHAVEDGYRDSAWAANDPDLLILHDVPAFDTLLSNMSPREREEAPAGHRVTTGI